MKASNPEAGIGEIGKMCGERWREMGEADKAVWEAKAKEDKAKEEKAKEALNSFKLELASSQPVLNAYVSTALEKQLLEVMSMEGFGTDAFVYLSRLGDHDEPLP